MGSRLHFSGFATYGLECFFVYGFKAYPNLPKPTFLWVLIISPNMYVGPLCSIWHSAWLFIILCHRDRYSDI